MEQWAGVVLAAGQGVRMNSKVPKVLHRVCGKELIRYPVEALQEVGVQRILVVVSPAVSQAVRGLLGTQVDYAIQLVPLGTGDALHCAAALLRGRAEHLLVQNADTPLVSSETLLRLMDCHLAEGDDMTLLTVLGAPDRDLGRVVRDGEGRVAAVVEAGDGEASSEPVREVNGGVYAFTASWLWDNLERVEPSPRGERYLTALAAVGGARGDQVQGLVADRPEDLLGVNNRFQLARVEAVLRQRIRERWMLAGVTLMDPASTFLDADVSIGQDTVILPNTMLLGRTSIGEECEVGPGSLIRDSTVGDRCRVTASVIEGSTLEGEVEVGPFSHLRPGAYLESHVHVGNFAEIKESHLASGVAMGHFGYVGDASVGAGVNLGAGTVTCNYDGKEKHRTVIEAGAFIGCDTMLVAPVTVGAAAATGAGSVVTNDVPPGSLVVGVPAKLQERKAKPR